MKNSILIQSLCMLLLVAAPMATQAQEIPTPTEKKVYNNNVYVSVSGDYGLFSAAQINYERKVPNMYKNSIKNSCYLRLGYGRYDNYVYGYGDQFTLTSNYCRLISGGHHFEFMGGFSLYLSKYEYVAKPQDLDKPSYTKVIYTMNGIPQFSLGYRYQKPGSRFLLKTGIGLPEFFHLGVGMGF